MDICNEKRNVRNEKWQKYPNLRAHPKQMNWVSLGPVSRQSCDAGSPDDSDPTGVKYKLREHGASCWCDKEGVACPQQEYGTETGSVRAKSTGSGRLAFPLMKAHENLPGSVV